MLVLVEIAYGLQRFGIGNLYLTMMHGELSNHHHGVVLLVVGFVGFSRSWVSRLYLYLLRVLRFRNHISAS